MNWRILISGLDSPARNMAIDEAIFQGLIRKTSKPTIRFYDWEPPTVSYGFHQEVNKEIDFDKLADMGFGYVRRPTGGRMVLHNREVTYAVIAPIETHLHGSVLESYASISKALAEGLNLMGIDVTFEKGSLSSDHQRQKSNPCFASSSRFELNYRNKKIIGSAQLRKNEVLLQHGSILLNHDQSKLAYLIPEITPTQRKRLASYLSRKTISINEILPAKLTFKQAVDHLINGFKKSWENDVFFEASELNDDEKHLVTNLARSKYLTDEWNKRK